MAVAPTGAIYKALKFDGVSSRTYGVYITGEAVYNAPERDVEMITIPGRSGSFALDKGRFENIEVTYPAGIAADTEAEFRDAISDFRNFLASRNGYVRLEDDYNPNEYRLAVYKSGLDVTPAQLRAGEFDITFDCKPQRYLKSGEDAIEVDSGDVVSNPTLFASSPMLEVEGHGTIEFNGFDITINDVVIGNIDTSIAESRTLPVMNNSDLPKTYSKTIDYSSYTSAVENGDSLFMASIGIQVPNTEIMSSSDPNGAVPSPTITSGIGTPSVTDTVQNYTQIVPPSITMYFAKYMLRASIADIELTAFTNETYTALVSTEHRSTGGVHLETITISISITNTASGILTIDVTYNSDGGLDGGGVLEFGETHIDSTKSILGSPLYLDCDLGEAYKYEGGSVISVNAHVDLGSDLPTLAPGANTVTFDNTITDLQIVPRWWKI